nr:hypothetical protein [Tanacetum cinerariifolium]
MDLLYTLLETCTTLTRRVKHLEQDKIAQTPEITKLKQRVKKLERRNKLKVSKLRRLKKVGTAQRVDTSEDTVIDDVSKQGEIIANLDSDEDVNLKDVTVVATEFTVEKDAEIEKNADDDELEPAELKEVVEVVTTAKLMTEVVTAASATINSTTIPITVAIITTALSAARRRKGVVIRDPKETATPFIIIHYRKRQTEAQVRKNMMIYLRNMDGFKMDYFKGMSYDDIRPIFEKYFNSNVAFLEKTKEHLEEEESRALTRKTKSQVEKAAKKQKLDEEMILLVERRYTLTRFTMDQMLNNVILEVEEEIPAATITAAPVRVVAASTRRRKGVVIRDPEEESTTFSFIPADTKSKDKGKRIMIEEPKPLKKKQQVEMDEEYARKLHVELNKDIDWDAAIDHVKQKAKEDPAMQRYQTKEQMEEEESRALQSINETPAQKAAKGRKLNEEVEDLKRHLEIVPDKDDDIYTKSTPLARKVFVVDYEIINLNNKPYYKIIRADGTHQLHISFLTLLKNFNREDLEALWNLVKESFSTSKPKNFSDDFLLTTLGAMFEKPDGQSQVWKNQRTIRGQAKVKSWKLLELCGVHIITFSTTQLILLVQRRYLLSRFTLDQMLNAVRLRVEEESEMSLELLRFTGQQHQEGQLE